MFTHKAIAELNALELMVYNYVSKHKNQVMYMTIRELAEAAGVSTTTVLRFCKKMGCDGYSNFASVSSCISNRAMHRRSIPASAKSSAFLKASATMSLIS